MEQSRWYRIRTRRSVGLVVIPLLLSSTLVGAAFNLVTAGPAAAALTTSPITLVSGNGPTGSLDSLVRVSTTGAAGPFSAATVSQLCGGWSVLSGTQWDSINNSCSPGSGTFYYEASFSLPVGFSNPSLTVTSFSDDQATAISLNGNTFATVTDTNNGAWTGTPSSVSDSTASDFRSGTNTVEFVVPNTYGGPGGIDFSAVVTYVQPTTLSYTGPSTAMNGQAVTLSGVLTTNGTPLGGESVTFTLGTGSGAQSCAGMTDPSGMAKCTISSVDQPVGPGDPITASFAGSTSYGPSSASSSATVFDLNGQGAFVVGDISAGAPTQGNMVNFWGAQWARHNAFSGETGRVPSAMKGFADNLTTSGSFTDPASLCGGTWTTSTGDSVSPPPTVPQYMYVIVSSSVTQSGSVITGNIEHVVVIRVNPGYGQNPGHAGTGEVVGVIC